jgi:putative DNA modification/repair radical SAM protein
VEFHLRPYSKHLYSIRVDLGEKLEFLASSARYDASCASSGSSRRSPGGLGASSPAGVCHSFTGDGRCISLLKVLYSNSCGKECAYCANRASADIKRTSFTVDELVRLTIGFYRRNYIEGLFLSSGIFADPDIVMEKLIEVAKALRERERFGGYIHLKAIPGCGDKLLKKAGLYADRLSANIELPTASSLARLAPQKSGDEILGAMRFMGQAEAESREDRCRFVGRPRCDAPRFAPAGQSTQLVIGASPDDDRTIIRLAGALYSRLGLRRVYYSAFVPVSTDPRLPLVGSPPLLREHRLYQADWLLRFYGFRPEELLPEGESNFSAEIDPKMAWALRHPDFFPVDIDRAEYGELLRVPGVGVIGAGRIISTRKAGRIRPEDLPRMGVVMKRARCFLCSRGRPLASLDYAAIDRAQAEKSGGADWTQVSPSRAAYGPEPALSPALAASHQRAKTQLEFSFA